MKYKFKDTDMLIKGTEFPLIGYNTCGIIKDVSDL